MPDFLDRLGDELVRAARAPQAHAPAQGRALRRPWWLRRPGRARAQWLLAGALLLVSAAGGAAIATSGRPTPGAAPPELEGLIAGGLDRADTSFAIFRRGVSENDQIPERLSVTLSGASGADLRLARRARGVGAEGTWVVPGRGSLCLVSTWPADRAGGADCQPDAQAMAGKLVVSTQRARTPGLQFIAGLVPDGVRTVQLHVAGSAAITLAVQDNVYVATVAGSAQSVTFTGPHGQVRVEELELPPVAATR